MSFLGRLTRFFFSKLYTQFAWAYDFVAWVASLGKWKEWVCLAESFVLSPGKILETGHGPGHLTYHLHKGGYSITSVDPSRQMGKLCLFHFRKANAQPHLVQTIAQALPFSAGSFETIIATFPTNYIFDTKTIREFWRMLAPKGRLIVLLSVEITQKNLAGRLLNLLYHFTGQFSPPSQWQARFTSLYHDAGFIACVEQLTVPGANLFFLIGDKPDVM